MFNLKEYILSLNYTINSDGTYTILQDVDIQHKNLYTLYIHDFKIKEIKGHFNCSYNNLENLDGSPEIVDGNFFCYSNKLTSLKGCPRKVGLTFSASNNNITELIVSPYEIGKDFYIYSNKLINLQNSPALIHGIYDCHDNRLNSLSGATINISKINYDDNTNLTQKEIDLYFDYVLSNNPSMFVKFRKILSIQLLEKYNHLKDATNFNMI
jgi:hypothetical protein